MPVFAQALICGTNWPADRRSTGVGSFRSGAVVAAVVVAAFVAGCEDPDPGAEVDVEVAAHHAGTEALQEARATIETARRLVLLHPDSERQRQAREHLRYFREHADHLEVDDSGDGPREVQPPGDRHIDTAIEDSGAEDPEPRREELP